MTWFDPRSHAQDLVGMRRMLIAVARPTVITIVWRWRYELLAGVGSAVGLTGLVRSSGLAGLIAASIVAGMLSGVVTLWLPARRLAAARIWCVVTPHRIRTGCAQAWVHSRSGRIPVVLLTRAHPTGERVWLWCRAGTSPADLQAARSILVAACWAVDIHVTPSRRYAHIAAVDVIRRLERPVLRDVTGVPRPGSWPHADGTVARPQWQRGEAGRDVA